MDDKRRMTARDLEQAVRKMAGDLESFRTYVLRSAAGVATPPEERGEAHMTAKRMVAFTLGVQMASLRAAASDEAVEKFVKREVFDIGRRAAVVASSIAEGTKQEIDEIDEAMKGEAEAAREV
jgi:hypothetical protein